jgi:hypothetical protein
VILALFLFIKKDIALVWASTYPFPTWKMLLSNCKDISPFHTYKKPFVLEAREHHWPSIIFGSIPSSYHSQSYNFQIRGEAVRTQKQIFSYT